MNHESARPSVRWPIVRVRPGSEATVQLLDHRFARIATHYGPPTQVCPEGHDCPLCEIGSSRPYWYLPVSVVALNRPGLVELSSAGASNLEQSCKLLLGTFQAGCQVSLSRKTAKAAVYAEPLTVETLPRILPPHIWLSALMAIYKLPALHEGEELEAYSARIRQICLTRAELTASRVRADAASGVKSRR